MIYFIHKFMVSSGKDRKEIKKVYDDRDVAVMQHRLLGGSLEMAQVIMTK